MSSYNNTTTPALTIPSPTRHQVSQADVEIGDLDSIAKDLTGKDIFGDTPSKIFHHVAKIALISDEAVAYLQQRGIKSINHLDVIPRARLESWVTDVFTFGDIAMTLKTKEVLIFFLKLLKMH